MQQVLAIIQNEDKILVGKLKAEKINDFGGLEYVLPGGTVEGGESFETAVIREAKEETGLNVEAIRELGFRIHPKTGKEIHYFLCNKASGELSTEDKLNDDLEELEWVETKRLLKIMPTLYTKVVEYLFKDQAPEATWISPNAEVKDSGIAGTGMFAKTDILKNEVVVVWGGTYVSKEEALRAEKQGKLTMQWDDDLFSVEDRGDDDGYFINHSCNPNLWMNGAYMLIAMRDIKAGEEITADYVVWEADENYVSKWECSCGSSNCRKRITGKDWMLKDLQVMYKDHFSPLLNKRIHSLTNE